jgi:hypothetical protein
MRFHLLPIIVLVLFACNSAGFERDERQIIAKDIIRKKIPYSHSFDVVSFRQDTVLNWPDDNIKSPVSYTLEITYQDSTDAFISKKAIVIFTPVGNTVLSSSVQDR